MENKHLCLLAEFDDQTDSKIKEIEKLLNENGFFGKQTKDIPYHITLGSYEISREAEIRGLLKEASRKIERLTVHFDSIGQFDSKVLYMKPELSLDLSQLHQFFDRDCIEFHKEWVPHTTLLIDEDEIIKKATLIVEEKFEKLYGRIERISLYEFFPTRFIDIVDLKEDEK